MLRVFVVFLVSVSDDPLKLNSEIWRLKHITYFVWCSVQSGRIQSVSTGTRTLCHHTPL